MLYQHQEEAIAFALERQGNACLFHDPGLGKTRAAMTIYARLRERTPGLRLLVVCPLSLIHTAWGEEAAFQHFRFRTLRGKGPHPDVLAVNFETFISKKYFEQALQFVKSMPYMVVVDESSRMKNHKSQTTKRLLELGRFARYRLCLSGTPAPNSETEYWAQVSFVDPRTWPNFYKFRNIYFHLERQGKRFTGDTSWANMGRLFQQGFRYAISPEKRAKLLAEVGKVSHIRKKEDCLDLPEKVYQVRQVALSAKEQKAYNEMRRHAIAEIGGGMVAAPAALAKMLKLREISSGFIYDEAHNAQVIGDSKLKELANVLDELGGRQVIIWCQFREEIAQITAMLKDKTVAVMQGGEDKEAAIEAFKTGKAQYLIAHPLSAGWGLTFTNCSVCVYYSISYSAETAIQSEDRTNRIGQTKTCYYIYLLAKGTIDEAIYAALQKKKSAAELLSDIMDMEGKR